MSDVRTVLSLLAHPDDAEFTCAGTLALLGQRGWQIHIATMTPGDCGSASLGPGRDQPRFAAGKRGCGGSASRRVSLPGIARLLHSPRSAYAAEGRGADPASPAVDRFCRQPGRLSPATTR